MHAARSHIVHQRFGLASRAIVVNSYIPAVAAERGGDRFADTSGRAGYERGAVLFGRFAYQSSLAACSAGEVWSRIAILAYQSAGPGGFIGSRHTDFPALPCKPGRISNPWAQNRSGRQNGSSL